MSVADAYYIFKSIPPLSSLSSSLRRQGVKALDHQTRWVAFRGSQIGGGLARIGTALDSHDCAADVEGNFLAYDAKTGAQLYRFNTGSGTRGSPITYAVNGRQYIAVPSGLGSIFTGGLGTIWPEARNFQNGSTLFVFALPPTSKAK